MTLDDPIAGGNEDQHYVFEYAPPIGTRELCLSSTAIIAETGTGFRNARFNDNGGTVDEYIVAQAAFRLAAPSDGMALHIQVEVDVGPVRL